MAAATDSTFDLVPPRRPSLDDVGSAGIVDHATLPPIGPRMPTAAMLNIWQRLVARLCGVVPIASFSVTFSAGTPSIAQFVAMPTGPITNTFTVHDIGNGNTSITWPAGTFPASTLKPKVSLNEDVAALAPVAFLISNGVQVKTRNDAGTLTDIGFTVDVF